jgi:hypothetical protein
LKPRDNSVFIGTETAFRNKIIGTILFNDFSSEATVSKINGKIVYVSLYYPTVAILVMFLMDVN